jgi:hypothetical protein
MGAAGALVSWVKDKTPSVSVSGKFLHATQER